MRLFRLMAACIGILLLGAAAACSGQAPREPRASSTPETSHAAFGSSSTNPPSIAATPASTPTPVAGISVPATTRPAPSPVSGPSARPTLAVPAGTPTPAATPTPVFTRIAGTHSVPPSPPYAPLPLQPDEKLEKQVRELLGEEAEAYGIVVKRLSDGAGFAINADREFYAASLFKVLVMYEVFKQRELNLVSFDESLTIAPPYLDFTLGEPRWPLWSEVSVGDLLEAMITESDNMAAMMLHDRTGGWNIVADLRAIGLAHTDIANDILPTSAGDMALWLEMMARGKAVDEDTSQEMIDLLARQKINDRLPALLPPGTKVAHKTGNWDNATHDVGVVYAPHGAYVIAVLSDKPDRAESIAELSRLVYEYLEARG